MLNLHSFFNVFVLAMTILFGNTLGSGIIQLMVMRTLSRLSASALSTVYTDDFAFLQYGNMRSSDTSQTKTLNWSI